MSKKVQQSNKTITTLVTIGSDGKRKRVPKAVSQAEKGREVARARVLLEGDVELANKKLRPARVRYAVLMTLFVAVIIGSLVFLGKYLYDTNQAQSQYDGVTADFVATVPEDLMPDEEDIEPPDTSAWPPIVDFAALQADNPDVSGWLRIPGTSVDYPIMTSPERDYYLDHDMYGNYSSSGAIFADYENTHELSEPHLVIYGHHMNVPMMFHDVSKYSDPEFLDSHRVIYLVLPETTYVLKVQGTYIADGGEYEARQTRFNLHEHFQQYMDTRLARSDQNIRDDYDRFTLDRFVTLVTCTNYGDTRQIVECTVEQEYPTDYIPNVVASALAGL